jgi:hypothetical protein
MTFQHDQDKWLFFLFRVCCVTQNMCSPCGESELWVRFLSSLSVGKSVCNRRIEALNTNCNHLNPEMRQQHCLKSGCSCQCYCHEAANSFPWFCCQSEDAKSFVEHWQWVRVKGYVTTVGLPPIRLGAKILEAHDQRFFLQLNLCCHSPYVTSSLTRGWVCLSWIGFAFVKCTYLTYGIGRTWSWEVLFLPGKGSVW